MKLNPFENQKNEFELCDVLMLDKYWYRIKKGYKKLLHCKDKYAYVDYEQLVRSINTQIDWKILTTGEYQGDYFYFAKFNNKFYFVQICYGSCSGCDELLAREEDIDQLSELRENIKHDIREFDSLEELKEWIEQSIQSWCDYKTEVLEFVEKRASTLT